MATSPSASPLPSIRPAKDVRKAAGKVPGSVPVRAQVRAPVEIGAVQAVSAVAPVAVDKHALMQNKPQIQRVHLT